MIMYPSQPWKLTASQSEEGQRACPSVIFTELGAFPGSSELYS